MRLHVGAGLYQGFPQAGQTDAFSRAIEARHRSRAVGFDDASGWNRFDGIYKHLRSEVREFGETVKNNEPIERQMDEMGDVLYVAAQLADFQGINPNRALEHATDKFVRRMDTMQTIAAERNLPFDRLHKRQWRTLWQEAKVRLNTP